MIRTGTSYRDGLRDGREVWVDGERVRDVTAHPALKPIIDVKDSQKNGAMLCTTPVVDAVVVWTTTSRLCSLAGA